MTEAEWLACDDPTPMLVCLQGMASDRRLRLFCCACVRRIWHRLSDADAGRRAIEAAELFADGHGTKGELAAFASEADRLGQGANDRNQSYALQAAALCGSGEMDALSAARTASWAAACVERGTTIDERWGQSHLLRDIFGNPFRPVAIDSYWLTSTALTLARVIDADRAFDRLPILADALEDAGCDSAELLAHCRSDGPHVRGCWAVDLVLGKA